MRLFLENIAQTKKDIILKLIEKLLHKSMGCCHKVDKTPRRRWRSQSYMSTKFFYLWTKQGQSRDKAGTKQGPSRDGTSVTVEPNNQHQLNLISAKDGSIAQAYCDDLGGWNVGYEGEYVCAPRDLFQDSGFAPIPSEKNMQGNGLSDAWDMIMKSYERTRQSFRNYYLFFYFFYFFVFIFFYLLFFLFLFFIFFYFYLIFFIYYFFLFLFFFIYYYFNFFLIFSFFLFSFFLFVVMLRL